MTGKAKVGFSEAGSIGPVQAENFAFHIPTIHNDRCPVLRANSIQAVLIGSSTMTDLSGSIPVVNSGLEITSAKSTNYIESNCLTIPNHPGAAI